MKIEEIISKAVQLNVSDIHIVDDDVFFRIDGNIEKQDMYSPGLADYFGPLLESKESDSAIGICGTRCRVNVYKSRGNLSVAIRLLKDHIPTLDELGLPKSVVGLTEHSQGLVLITGQTGSGKSTTLASLLEYINQNSQKHILTLEDPIEYIYEPKNCLISQRAIGKDTDSFGSGLRAALREDPDVILVGEMRDLDTIETAITAAETGHLVLGTLHTNSAVESIDRIIGVFSAEKQPQVRLQLSLTLKAVLSQQLLLKVGGGRILAYEMMNVNGAIRNLIRSGKTYQIENILQTSASSDNILMDRCLQLLKSKNLISDSVYTSALRDKTSVLKDKNAPYANSKPNWTRTSRDRF